ncbi:MAG: nuclear transport factor 2 family protein [Opitutus sp.]|nr:nuclear transport factor 2 family protein [Opitutus sp.]
MLTLRAAGTDAVIAAVKAADDARVAATTTADPTGIGATYSDDLRYAHSSGIVDTKASFTKALVSRATIYSSYKYLERTFVPAAPGIVLMHGRVATKVQTDGPARDLELNFLAVWREENSKWRMLAWQSSRPPAPAPAAK